MKQFIALIAFLFLSACVQVEQSESIKIGAVLPLSGWGAYWGSPEQKGIALAVDEIRAQGGKIEVIIEDSKTGAKDAATAGSKLINIDKVQGIISEFAAPSSSISPMSVESRIPVIYDALSKKILSENPYALKVYFDSEKECYVATKYLAQKGYKVIGGVILNLDFSPECKRGMDKTAGENEIAVKYYDFDADTTDFKTIITKMQNDKIESVVFIGYEDHALIFFKQRSDLGFIVPVFTGTSKADTFTDKVISESPKESLEGTITYDQKIREGFVQKMNARHPEITDPDLFAAATGYDEIMYLYRGLSKCSGKSAECVVSAIMSDKDYQSALETEGFGADRVMHLIPSYSTYSKGELIPLEVE